MSETHKGLKGERNLLLTVAGKTPATITEALWGLAVGRKLTVHGLRILTTGDAAGDLRRDLPGAMDALARDYPKAFKALEIDLQHDLRICRGTGGQALDDIRTSDDNRSVADWILKEVAECCADDDMAVHASLAGGRKTMSFFLGTAMQLLGRAQDRLYHVLVPPEYEVAGFYYPAPRKRLLTDRQGKALDMHRATVGMAEIPFVRLRSLFEESALPDLATRLSFSDLVARADSVVAGPKLEVHVYWQRRRDQPRPRICYRLPGAQADLLVKEFQKPDTFEFVVYTYLLWRRQSDGLLGSDTPPRPIPIFRHDELPQTFLDLQDWLRRLGRGDRSFDIDGSVMGKTLRNNIAGLQNGDEEFDIIRANWQHDISPRIVNFNKDLKKEFTDKAPRHEPAYYLISGIGHGVPHRKKGY